MAEVLIRDSVWDEFVAIAHKRRQAPQALAQRVLREYVSRMNDEELMARSARAARRSAFSMGQSEKIVRNYRRRTRR